MRVRDLIMFTAVMVILMIVLGLDLNSVCPAYQ